MLKSILFIYTLLTLSLSFAGDINQNVVETYFQNELVISQIWIELAPQGTMRDAVQKWQEMGRPALKFNCVAFKPCAHAREVAGGIPACIRNVELVVSAKSIRATINFHPENPAIQMSLAPRILGSNLLERLETSSEKISASWDEGEQILDLKSSKSDEGVRHFMGNLDSDPQGATGLTLDQDLNFGLKCTPNGYSNR